MSKNGLHRKDAIFVTVPLKNCEVRETKEKQLQCRTTCTNNQRNPHNFKTQTHLIYLQVLSLPFKSE